MIAPFAPHIAEELWERLGTRGEHLRRPHLADFDPEKPWRARVTIAVQVNGKLRAPSKSPGARRRRRARAARAEENVARHLDGVTCAASSTFPTDS
jgi:leucyl-tRNA synthetase